MRKGFLKFRNFWGIAACLLCLTACEEEEQTKGGAETEKEATILGLYGGRELLVQLSGNQYCQYDERIRNV